MAARRAYARRMIRLILAGMLVLASLAAHARALEGRVIEVTDGDTITVLSNGTSTHRVRLIGIDAPERFQNHGDMARERLRRLLRGKNVRIEWERMDDYGRIVGTVYVAEGDVPCARAECLRADAAVVMLREGHAWLQKPADPLLTAEQQQLYSRAEKQARAGKSGLWREASAVPPWEWRSRQKLGVFDAKAPNAGSPPSPPAGRLVAAQR